MKGICKNITGTWVTMPMPTGIHLEPYLRRALVTKENEVFLPAGLIGPQTKKYLESIGLDCVEGFHDENSHFYVSATWMMEQEIDEAYRTKIEGAVEGILLYLKQQEAK